VSLLQTSVAAGASGPLIVLSGVADISTIAQLSGVITSQLSEITRQLMIDVSDLRFADSAAIALLLLVARTLKGQGGTMVLIWPQPAVARAVTLADLGQIIMIQGRTPRTPELEGGGGSPELGPRCPRLAKHPGTCWRSTDGTVSRQIASAGTFLTRWRSLLPCRTLTGPRRLGVRLVNPTWPSGQSSS
jgi:anti-anti-sigma factor